MLIVFLVLCAGAVLLIRFLPPVVAEAHVDPESAAEPGHGGVKRIGEGAPVFAGSPARVLNALSEIAMATPRTALVAGSATDGMITFVVRSRVFRFQDYVTFKATAEGSDTRLSILARTRYPGASDWGVNRKRLEQWLADLSERVGEAG
ncbi:MAG: DUF1499 domain-containing protein [Pseudomonadota bacterium]